MFLWSLWPPTCVIPIVQCMAFTGGYHHEGSFSIGRLILCIPWGAMLYIPNIRNLRACFGVVTACVYTLSCFHFLHEIVIPLIYSEQNIIKNIKIDVFNLILYIEKNTEWEWVEPAVSQVKVAFAEGRRQRRAEWHWCWTTASSTPVDYPARDWIEHLYFFLLPFSFDHGKITSFWARLKWSNLFI